MAAPIGAAAIAALAHELIDWRFKGLPASWSGRTVAEICADRPSLFEAGVLGPVCVLRAEALTHNLNAMAGWCRDRGVEIAPHGKTHMAPQLLGRQLEAGACAITAATLSQVRVFRAFGVRDVVLASAYGRRVSAAATDRCRGLRGGARSRHHARRTVRRHRLFGGDARRGDAAGPPVRDGPRDRDCGRQHVFRRGCRRAGR